MNPQELAPSNLVTISDILRALRDYHVDMLYVVNEILTYEYKITSKEQVTPALLKKLLLDYADSHAAWGDTEFANDVRAIAGRIS